MDKVTNSRLLDMKEYAEKAIMLLGNLSYDEFAQDIRTNLAVTRCIEIMGEAASHVPETEKAEIPEIAWKEIIGIRVVLAHAYMRITLRTIYDIVRSELPALINQIEKVTGEK